VIGVTEENQGFQALQDPKDQQDCEEKMDCRDFLAKRESL
jgi:hypothetical protein